MAEDDPFERERTAMAAIRARESIPESREEARAWRSVFAAEVEVAHASELQQRGLRPPRCTRRRASMDQKYLGWKPTAWTKRSALSAGAETKASAAARQSRIGDKGHQKGERAAEAHTRARKTTRFEPPSAISPRRSATNVARANRSRTLQGRRSSGKLCDELWPQVNTRAASPKQVHP